MKKISTKVALAVVCWAVVAAQAVAQMVGGVNYKIVSKTDKTAEVTWLVGDDDDPFADDPVYTGEVVIPEKVKIAGVDYTGRGWSCHGKHPGRGRSRRSFRVQCPLLLYKIRRSWLLSPC